jgi:hypothetical protein
MNLFDGITRRSLYYDSDGCSQVAAGADVPRNHADLDKVIPTPVLFSQQPFVKPLCMVENVSIADSDVSQRCPNLMSSKLGLLGCFFFYSCKTPRDLMFNPARNPISRRGGTCFRYSFHPSERRLMALVTLSMKAREVEKEVLRIGLGIPRAFAQQSIDSFSSFRPACDPWQTIPNPCKPLQTLCTIAQLGEYPLCHGSCTPHRFSDITQCSTPSRSRGVGERVRL